MEVCIGCTAYPWHTVAQNTARASRAGSAGYATYAMRRVPASAPTHSGKQARTYTDCYQSTLLLMLTENAGRP